jgi:methylaspartate mutase sigma subunit
MGHEVVNLGPCPPEASVIHACRQVRPELVVFSTTNGHGRLEAPALVRRIRECHDIVSPWTAIGGKIDCVGGSTATTGELLAAGFDAVFPESDGLVPFIEWVGWLERVGRGPLVPVA